MLDIRSFDPLRRAEYNGQDATNLDDMAFNRNFLQKSGSAQQHLIQQRLTAETDERSVTLCPFPCDIIIEFAPLYPSERISNPRKAKGRRESTELCAHLCDSRGWTCVTQIQTMG